MIVVDASTLLASLVDDDLADLTLERYPHTVLAERSWELRSDVTAYDAHYVALAEALAATLVTSDRPLSRADGPRCRTELLRLT